MSRTKVVATFRHCHLPASANSYIVHPTDDVTVEVTADPAQTREFINAKLRERARRIDGIEQEIETLKRQEETMRILRRQLDKELNAMKEKT